jgi:hypothetical protein
MAFMTCRGPNWIGQPVASLQHALELGLFLGAKRFGDEEQRRKRALVLDVERYRYQRFISDLAGVDVTPHEARPRSW